MHIYKITYMLLLSLLVPLCLIAPVITLNLAPSNSLAAETSSRYALTVNINPTNAGTVILSPSQPEDDYYSGKVLTLTADTTLSSYQSDHWSGDVSETDEYVSITVNSDNNVNAHLPSFYLDSVLDEIRSNVNILRGLSPLEPVNHWFITEEELGQMLAGDFEENIDDIAINQEILVLLDLLEEDQDLHTILVNLYSEAVLGLYDPELARMYITGDIEQFGIMEEMTYAHEYTHALQDQYFDLSSLGLDSEGKSDMSQAMRSLVEGDARLLEAIYYWYVFDDTEREIYDQQLAQGDNGVYDDVPQFIIEDLVFPYSAGVNFVLTIWQDGGGWEGGGGWDAVNDVYSNLPQSTEQIIHPEKYLQQDEPQTVTIPDLEVALGGTWSQLETNVLGELWMRLYLEAFIDTDLATIAAEGWDGDRFAYLKDDSDNKLLVISSIWDSITDANDFYNAYIAFVQEKSGGDYSLSLNETGKRWWKSDGMSLYLGQQGSEVLIVIAPDDNTAAEVLTEFPQFYTPAQAIFSTSITQVLAEQTIDFTDSSTGEIISWSWDFDNDGIVDSTNQSTSHSYANPGTYTVSLTISDPAISTTETKIEYISVYAAPQAAFSADKTKVTKGKAVQFTNLSSAGVPPSTYEWDFDSDGITDSTAENPSYFYSTPGTYTVVLKLTDSANHTDIETNADYITVTPEKGLPFWIWIVIGTLAVGVVGGVTYLVSKRRAAG